VRGTGGGRGIREGEDGEAGEGRVWEGARGGVIDGPMLVPVDGHTVMISTLGVPLYCDEIIKQNVQFAY